MGDEGIAGFGLDAAGGERWSWMGDPTVLKVTGKHTGGRLAVAEIVSTPESLVPLHVHHREDEAFYVLEGEVTFTVGDETFESGPGTFAFGPKDVPHRYTVLTPTARMLMLFSPAGFEGFIRETGEPTVSLEATPPEVDVEVMLATAARYGAEVLE